jgi:hypothetical protein
MARYGHIGHMPLRHSHRRSSQWMCGCADVAKQFIYIIFYGQRYGHIGHKPLKHSHTRFSQWIAWTHGASQPAMPGVSESQFARVWADLNLAQIYAKDASCQTPRSECVAPLERRCNIPVFFIIFWNTIFVLFCMY